MKLWHTTSRPLKDFVIMTLYRFTVVPVMIFAVLILAILGHKKIRQGFKMRWPQRDHHPWFDLPKKKQPLWIHCASGEFEYAKPVITRIKENFPREKILVTYFSSTYKKNVENFCGVDMSCPLPWDTPGAMSSFIKYHQPKVLLIARTDLWPEMLFQMRTRNLPTLLFSATLHKAKGKWLRLFWSWLYQQLSLVYCVSQSDKVNFLNMKVPVVIPIGDTRYDQVLARLATPKALKSFLQPPREDDPLTFVAGSTWEEDEAILFKACANFIKIEELRLIVAPHEPTPDHLKKLGEQLNSLGLTYQLYSQSTKWFPQHIMIIDQVGLLAEIYRCAHVAFVGGSFKKSVHSVMEPLAAGALTLVGPYHHNNREALDFKQQKLVNFGLLPAVHEVRDKESLRRSLHKLIEDKASLIGARTEIIELIKTKTGASQKIIDWLKQNCSL